MRRARKHSKSSYRSGLEVFTAEHLENLGVPYEYEKYVIKYTKPETYNRYTPDFILTNNWIIIETKGQFTTADRKKHKLIKDQHPGLDIRFVFSRSLSKISKQSKTTYAKWCDDAGFLYADKVIPSEWLEEPYCQVRHKAVMELIKR